MRCHSSREPGFSAALPRPSTRAGRSGCCDGSAGCCRCGAGGHGVEQHVASAQAVVRAGGVFVLFPEGGVAGGPDDITAFRAGAAIIALRTGAPVLPFVMVGNQELYLGRRLVTRILPATTARDLLKIAPDAALPEPNSREEIALAKSLTDAFEDILAPEVHRLYAQTVDPPGRPRRLRGLTWLLLKRPKAGRPVPSRRGRRPTRDRGHRLPPRASRARRRHGSPSRGRPHRQGPSCLRGLAAPDVGTGRLAAGRVDPWRLVYSRPNAVRRNDPRSRRSNAPRPAHPRRPRPRPRRAPAAPAREAGDAQPGRLGEGPDRAADDRGGGAGRACSSPAARSSSRPAATPATASPSPRP